MGWEGTLLVRMRVKGRNEKKNGKFMFVLYIECTQPLDEMGKAGISEPNVKHR